MIDELDELASDSHIADDMELEQSSHEHEYERQRVGYGQGAETDTVRSAAARLFEKNGQNQEVTGQPEADDEPWHVETYFLDEIIVVEVGQCERLVLGAAKTTTTTATTTVALPGATSVIETVDGIERCDRHLFQLILFTRQENNAHQLHNIVCAENAVFDALVCCLIVFVFACVCRRRRRVLSPPRSTSE